MVTRLTLAISRRDFHSCYLTIINHQENLLKSHDAHILQANLQSHWPSRGYSGSNPGMECPEAQDVQGKDGIGVELEEGEEFPAGKNM